MKKNLMALLAAGLLALAAHAPAAGYSSNTNFGTVGVGSPTLGTYTILSGTAEQYREVALTSVLTGSNGTTALADSVITTGLYVANPTNLTLSAGAIFFPAEVDTGIARVRVRVPKMYQGSPRLLLDVHCAVTYTPGVSITATAVQYPVGGLTNTTLVTLGPVYLSLTTSSVNAPYTVAFPVGLTLVPESVVTYHVKKAGANIVEVTGIRFGYRGAGVVDGQ